jgi:Icc-related predicted phosphoesterase
MLVCAAGDIHGAIDQMFDHVLQFEQQLGVSFDVVLHVGDFGAWPDPGKLDKATVKRDGPGDFAKWVNENKTAPRTTVFIPGNHEDFDYLAKFVRPTEILPGLTYLPSGEVLSFNLGGQTLRIGAVGGCFSPKDYEISSSALKGKARRHFTKDQVERVLRKTADGRLDIIMTHDAPTGVVVPTRKGGKVASPAQGLGDLVKKTKPRLSLFGHHHARVDAEIDGVRSIGLNCAPHPGSLVAIDFAGHSSQYLVLGEWPGL